MVSKEGGWVGCQYSVWLISFCLEKKKKKEEEKGMEWKGKERKEKEREGGNE